MPDTLFRHDVGRLDWTPCGPPDQGPLILKLAPDLVPACGVDPFAAAGRGALPIAAILPALDLLRGS